jgi:PelA/Pel-15E family pectate lyase
VSFNGGYLWKYSSDLKLREGEEIASSTTAWIQPPGTPAVGEALLYAYQLTGEQELLDDARQTAYALVQGQLESGGWDSQMELGGEARGRYAYRTNSGDSDAPRKRNATTLDDNKTQSAMQFLMNIDRELDFADPKIHECILYALEHVLAAQFPNGGWPQRFSAPPDPQEYPAIKASFPEDWSRTWQKQPYANYYTFNDNAIADMIDTMYRAYWIYGDERYRQSALKAGEFILSAQLPEPQPAWAQQYDRNMQPAWARKFEPPAITGGESQGVINTLLTLYEYSGQDRFLEPVPRAIEYLQSSKRSDGKLARFYEIGTNKPLYFTKDYKLTYSDADMPTHYAFIVGHKLDRLQQRYEKLKASTDHQPRTAQDLQPRPVRLSDSLNRRAAQVINRLDDRGAWTARGRMQEAKDQTLDILDCRIFISNLRTLAEHASAKP